MTADLKVYKKINGMNIIIPHQLTYFIDTLQQFQIDAIAISEWIDTDDANVCLELYLPELKVYIIFETDTFKIPHNLKKKLFKKYKKHNILIGNWKDLLHIIIEKINK
jgi:hypothetical protein